VRICLTNSLGKKNGIYKSYWDNGQLEAEVNYIDGLTQRIFKSYHLNGKIFFEINYIEGKKV
jgi:antitoxin component YwqK of YwqJK toxin-antitoxin module